MKLLDTVRATIKRLVPPSLLPEPKVAAAGMSAGVVTLVVWALGKKGYKVPRKNIQRVLTGAVAFASSVPPVVAYIKASPKPAKVGAKVAT